MILGQPEVVIFKTPHKYDQAAGVEKVVVDENLFSSLLRTGRMRFHWRKKLMPITGLIDFFAQWSFVATRTCGITTFLSNK